MTPEFITTYFLEAIKTAVMLAGPMLLVGLVVGIVVSMFQAATQINEMTLVFVPKMLGVALALQFFFPMDAESNL
jgi:flagellar biosynthetic protein FliQ